MTSAQWEEEVHDAIWQSLLKIRCGDIALRVDRGFADVRWDEVPTLAGRREVIPRLRVRVEEDWLQTVAARGLIMVSGALILRAQPTCPVNTPEGCDGCWTVLASRWQYAQRKGPRLTFAVRYGSQTVLCDTPRDGMETLLHQFERGLGAVGDLPELPDW